MNLPVLEFSSTSQATTYHLRPAASEYRHAGYGWAMCTVNDYTGELQITSDWGEFAHRWHADPKTLGAPTLSHFIANRQPAYGYPDTYLADKLTGGDNRHKRSRFSPERSVYRLREFVVEAFHDGNITGEVGQELWDELGELEHQDDERDFGEAFYEIDGHEHIISDSLHEYTQHESTGCYLVLRDAILPALVAAVSAHLTQHDDWYARALARYAAEVMT